jgi:hypothetical protein
MTTVVPPPPPMLPSAPSAPLPTIIVSNPPSLLLQLPLGALFNATLLGPAAAKGTVQLQTPMGTLTAQTGFPLPANAALTLVIQNLGQQARLLITSVNGTPLSPGGRAATPPAQGAAPGATLGSDTVTLGVGRTLTATLVRPAATGPALAAAPASGLPGTASPTPTPGAQTLQPATTTPGAQTGGAAPSGQPAASGVAPPSQPGGALGAGSHAPVRIIAVTAPGQTAQPATTPQGPSTFSQGATLTGTVTDATVSGQPVVRTPAGMVALATRTVLPPGTTVTLEVTGTPSSPLASPTLAPMPLEPRAMLQTRTWPALVEMVETLRVSDPAAARQLVNTIIPRANSQLAAGMMNFVSALRSGEVNAWVGDSLMRALERTKPDLSNRLKDDFGRMSRLVDEPAPRDWRMALIPFHNGAQVEQIRLFTRRPGQDEEDDASADRKGTRFVVDVQLSVLGRLQLDGMVRDQKHVDLIVRSQSNLPDVMRDDIRRIFQEAGEVTGVSGGIGFQAAPPNFVEPSPPEPDGDGVGLVV